MGLSSTLSNALGGMNASQRGIDVVSRNIANQGMPGYHRQSIVIEETAYGTSAQVRASTLSRAFNEALEKQHLAAVSSASYHDVRTSFLDRLQMHLGKPGDANSLDTLYAGFENAMQALVTNPNDVTTRAGVLNSAQQLVEQLNTLTGAVQEMRVEAEQQISNGVSELNRQLNALADVNVRILDISQDQQARLSLMDERDRLVASISELVDVRATYRTDGTVALMTESGVGILDVEASQFGFRSGGGLNSTSLFDPDPAKNGVGELTLRTPSGLQVDLAGQELLSSGRLAGLLELRDTTLVNMQDQLDEIAAGLAQAMNTVNSVAEPDELTPDLYELDLSGMQPGNSVAISYNDGTTDRTIRVVAMGDAANLPLASPNASGERVIGVDISGGDPAAAIAAALAGELPGGAVITDAGGVLSIDSADMRAMSSSISVTGTQDGVGALNLFVDSRDAAFTNSLDGNGQKRGFAGRISINTALISDPALMVQFASGVSLGDATRPEFLLDNLKSMEFVSDKMTALSDGGVRLSGKVTDLIGQMINHQGNVVSKAQSESSAVSYTLSSITTRMDAEYGVNVDEEMAGLMQLQNAYSASARVVSTVQELIDALLAM
ncbi:flagellar hook-associated protein FlgK [Pelagibacterium halotolerans]|uniref:Flagellar hook-associated protein 1 n=1 Tax=Pelagibacterium halotolerans (strain DSM 22347 / JCM 15775 / CGMCC 1.7692 / B2) TaxID=1082931 RepID=G4RES1_PELHB|nr:flagellar hook-associated protein FlgK [Pelagibacterium halotolerans]AEQ51892.1 flagellar hook-associated protein [Pelagibacterium halotolerans B2]QJR18304.1 flagellar hook-associated protein FlgK [Pelagibacterium halotolerans]SEA26257.1 flagellar hook-associated protein 1 FlgK [Pelagibacterium halotolerans]